MVELANEREEEVYMAEDLPTNRHLSQFTITPTSLALARLLTITWTPRRTEEPPVEVLVSRADLDKMQKEISEAIEAMDSPPSHG